MSRSDGASGNIRRATSEPCTNLLSSSSVLRSGDKRAAVLVIRNHTLLLRYLVILWIFPKESCSVAVLLVSQSVPSVVVTTTAVCKVKRTPLCLVQANITLFEVRTRFEERKQENTA